MAETLIRPTLKYIKLGYTVVLLIIVASFAGFALLPFDSTWKGRAWMLAVPVLLLIWPAERHLRRQISKATISGDKMRYETGFLSKSTRTIQLSRVQDARVDQSLSQRIFGVGNLSIETAGETSRLTMLNIENPHRVAEGILDAAKHAERDQNP